MRSHGNGHHAPIEETLAFLAPYRPAGNYTVASVGSNITYTVKPTDIVVLMDTSLGGQQTATADLGPGKTIGEKHTFIWFGWGGMQTPPTITGTGGATMMPYADMQSTGLTGLVASNTINQTGGFYTLEWTGAFWAQTG